MTLAVRGLACIRGERLVFADLSFIVGLGEAMIVQGPNGAGKTSLLRVLAGLTAPAGGEILWRGTAFDDDLADYHQQICFVGHQDGLKPVFSVAENLGFWAAMNPRMGDGLASAPPRALSALRRFGLGEIAAAPVRLLSAGQRRRLNLARLALRPCALWLLDEPTVGLDRAAGVVFAELAATHRRAGGAVIATTHVELDLPGAQILTL
jgi:heme exporter protein A